MIRRMPANSGALAPRQQATLRRQRPSVQIGYKECLVGQEPARRGGVQSLDRAVQILQTFTSEHPIRGVSEIARLVDIPPSTASRLLSSLAFHGLVRREDGEARYELGPELLRLGLLARGSTDLTVVARSFMVELRDATNETVALHIADAAPSRLVLDQVESRQALRRRYTEVGEPVPIHQGAASKLLLAHLPSPTREMVLGRRLETVAGVLVDPVDLRSELERIHAQGYAIAYGEREAGIGSLAVPLRDRSARVVAALSVSGPESRMTRTQIRREHLPAALRVSRELSALLGYDRPEATQAEVSTA